MARTTCRQKKIAASTTQSSNSIILLIIQEVAQTMGIEWNKDQIPCFKFRYQMIPHDIVCDVAIQGESPRHQYPAHIQYHIPR